MFLANWLTNCFFGAKGERQSHSIESELLPFPPQGSATEWLESKW
jgi:hypothetical protein